ncbi:hypothetical protein CVT25_014483 [Psilocybe cyanescens]|uniref:Uncharacterized protein n=1 Tax=Psilocybe cyanescens TaxID=93625 RepID=A0A409XRL3_PSICY|nr:hypothetical protein CVT25_014483 [Psilocybe cyanescens]
MLTESEIQTIIGSYALQTDQPSQVCLKLWFPPPAAWDSVCNGCLWIKWTEHNEEWFMKHIEHICKGSFQPLTAQEWRSKLWSQPLIWKLKKNVFNKAEEFVAHQFHTQDAAFHAR